ncbi:MAG: UDP-N-acetylmuramoyl-L-alanyl-D-glutamate--2,6-diaminopimelate ligase [Clostridia bacterium]|nr:UDP-N-acetylmuramoyl-L-alanyl-D-glutamate--2,6-diaminopimelate ligase [Clostridia bacterium]
MKLYKLLTESALDYTCYYGDSLLPASSLPQVSPADIPLSALVYDSRKAAHDTAFVCLSGTRFDGHDFADSAYERGCRIFFAERPLTLPADALTVVFSSTRAALAALSDAFFGHPQRELTVIGITGTKGKTTVTNLIASVLNDNQISCGTIGTIGITYDKKLLPTVNSTPESYEIHKTFRQMLDAGVRCVVMEVSSQALFCHRVDGIRFDIAVFTNLSEDHIGENEHPDFSHYMNAKQRLFSMCDFAVISADDLYSKNFRDACVSPYKTFGITASADFNALDIQQWKTNTAMGISFKLRHNTVISDQIFSLKIPGIFNASNALAAIGVLAHLGLSDKQIAPYLARTTVPGRFETLDLFDHCTVILDYAHNELSMTNLLQTVRSYRPKRIICLFGSIGGRSRHRRRELAEVTGDLADYAIITTDNPDFEDPDTIVSEIASYYTKDMCPHIAITDRKEAILYALDMLRDGDVFLLCGKGHENYQIVNGIHVPFSEKEILFEACAKNAISHTASHISASHI